jgi:hypothetical protein
MLLIFLYFLNESRIEHRYVNFKTLIWMVGVGIVLHGCTSLKNFSSEDPITQFATPQEFILQKNINHVNRSAKEYVYVWGAKHKEIEPQSLYPRKYLNQYCSAKEGKFKLLYKSSMTLVSNSSDKKRLLAAGDVKQGVGAYQCEQADGKNWIVSIEPVAEHKLKEGSETRVVVLQTKILSIDEAQKLYKNKAVNINIGDKRTHLNEQKNKKLNNKMTVKKDLEAKKNLEIKQETAVQKEQKVNPETLIKPASQGSETPQQQQLKAYVAARRDLNKGQNLVNACNNAQYAYNYGKLKATSASVYKDSGMLVARCLTSVPAYSSRFSNPKGQAVKILQNLATHHNHVGAKQKLTQLK